MWRGVTCDAMWCVSMTGRRRATEDWSRCGHEAATRDPDPDSGQVGTGAPQLWHQCTSPPNSLKMVQCEYDIWVLFPVVHFVLIRRQNYISSSWLWVMSNIWFGRKEHWVSPQLTLPGIFIGIHNQYGLFHLKLRCLSTKIVIYWQRILA